PATAGNHDFGCPESICCGSFNESTANMLIGLDVKQGCGTASIRKLVIRIITVRKLTVIVLPVKGCFVINGAYNPSTHKHITG
ncbi:MAG: hypothetical protein V3V57_16725, partial [Spirochaetia bacterium]